MNRAKVIKGLEVCTSKPCYCTDCPYKANCCLDSQEIMEDALAMLKEQEAVIHCIDCCYYHKPEYGFTFGDCTRRSAWYQVNEKDYCSLAKRKEGR